MNHFLSIDIEEAYQYWHHARAVLVDIRDQQSYRRGHVPGAFHLTEESLAAFMEENDVETAVMVMCYHGNSSRGIAQYLSQQGYHQTYSVEGGFDAWYRYFPAAISGEAD
ncbi:thiosulfate sulfurtransferase GlpE [Enterobacteriaceae bacterium ESL0689]|nr:thiosulfate sulfurtransferase GlpE [Enterobacteriaceae bacterium ESL0689]